MSPFLGVVIAVIAVLVILIVVVLRYTCRHQGTYFTNEAKGTEFAESADAALKNDPSLQESADESKKEYILSERMENRPHRHQSPIVSWGITTNMLLYSSLHVDYVTRMGKGGRGSTKGMPPILFLDNQHLA
ncbi:unnamed protein product [Staurois parvus]|uniref:Neurexin/syndecan/glycophorin C domain-containing protein n=1 Tax=Staurois parvus TaxID=386267 RepID=A0ABN9HQD9_9NEOB|nr:unnamed protein product [Staurois parvus]